MIKKEWSILLLWFWTYSRHSSLTKNDGLQFESQDATVFHSLAGTRISGREQWATLIAIFLGSVFELMVRFIASLTQ